MIVGGVEGGELKLDWEIVFIEEEIVVWFLPDDVDHNHNNQLEADRNQKGYSCDFKVGEFQHLYQGDAAADAQDIIEKDVTFTKIPSYTHHYPYYKTDALQNPKIKS